MNVPHTEHVYASDLDSSFTLSSHGGTVQLVLVECLIDIVLQVIVFVALNGTTEELQRWHMLEIVSAFCYRFCCFLISK